ncbi:hypothetical protein [Porphyrobacter sp. HT-58-2]|nr:hypothetical protein [Porphyrobacter sp. HT-58-2]
MERKAKADRLKGLVYAGFLLIGIYAALRFGGEWAYDLGKFIGAA